MKKLISLSLLIIALAACEKVSVPYQAEQYPGRLVPGPSVNPVTNIKAVCPSVATKGRASYYDSQNQVVKGYKGDSPAETAPKKFIQFGEENSVEPDVVVSHVPAYVQAKFEKVGGAVYPYIWLSDEFDENGPDNYIDVSVTRGTQTRPYHITLTRTKLNAQTQYVHEKDSVLFLTDGQMVELPSANCSWMITYRMFYDFSAVSSNTTIVMEASDRWINFQPGFGFSVSANEGYERRVGYVTLSDIYGENVHKIKITQEGTGWQDRQNEVLWEFYNATGGSSWKNNNGWVAGMAATAPRAGVAFNDKGRVTDIILNNNGLTGTLPKSFGELWAVTKIDLSDNELSGPIPDCLGKLHCLRELHLENNQLTGGIPESMKGLTRVTWLDLKNNKLTGEIPDWIFELPRFLDPPYDGIYLCLGDNYFSNYDPSKHCTHAWAHEDGGNHGGKTPDGFEYGGGVEINF